MSNAWDRLLWGVLFSSGFKGGSTLIGSSWDDLHVGKSSYPGEPTRALLFCSRSLARAWCRAKLDKYRDYPAGHPCLEWTFRPARVRESVEGVAP